MGFSDYLELELLDHVFKGDAFAASTAIWVSLHSGDPGEDGSSELAASNGYARVTALAKFGTVASAGAISNDAAIEFAACTGSDWAAATHFGIWDAETAGNFLAGGALSATKTVQVGDTASFAIGALDITLT